MYELTLITKYLRTKLAPLFAALAVTLCTAMVIIVISVMGGFLDVLGTAAQRVTGDIVITNDSYTGFGEYEEVIRRLEASGSFERATPVIETFALLNLGESFAAPIRITGVEPGGYAEVVRYRESLYWSAEDAVAAYEAGYGAVEGGPTEANAARVAELRSAFDLERSGMSLEAEPFARRRADERGGFAVMGLAELAEYDAAGEGTVALDGLVGEADRKALPGIVLGIETTPYTRRDERGAYVFAYSLVDEPVRLTFVPITPSGQMEQDVSPVRRALVVVNEAKTGLYELDANAAFVDFALLQQWLKMEASTMSVDPVTFEPLDEPRVISGRCTHVLAKAAEGVSLEDARAAAAGVLDSMAADGYRLDPMLRAITWRERHAQLLNAVQNEKGMVTFLFVVISIVAIVMVATTFYMIVLEKTRDIGTLRAIGASGWGVMRVFLLYGLGIGLLGSLAGLALAWFVVTHLNDLQAALAYRMGTLIAVTAIGLALVGGCLALTMWLSRHRDQRVEVTVWPTAVFAVALVAAGYFEFPAVNLGLAGLDARVGFMMWDPQLYYFDRIPDQVNPVEAAWIVVAAIASSVVGAGVPAVIAATFKPVEALRYE